MRRDLWRACGAALAAVMLSSCGPAVRECGISDCPLPTISSLGPDSVVAGGPTFTLTVSGTNFSPGSVVELSGNASTTSLTTTFIGEHTLSVSVPAAAIASVGTIQVTVDNGGALVSSFTELPVVPRPDFELSARPVSITIRPGDTDRLIQIAIRRLGGFSDTVNLSITGLPAGVTATFAPVTGTGSQRSTGLQLNASAAADVTNAHVTLRVDGTAGGIVHTLDISLNLFAASSVGIVDVISRNDLGILSNSANDDISLSADGRMAAFFSTATNLVVPAIQHMANVFSHDDCFGASGCSPTTRLASAPNAGTADGNNGSGRPTSISADGRLIGFDSNATNLTGRLAAFGQSYVRDTCANTPANCVPATNMVSLTALGLEPNNSSDGATISGDGRYVAFRSDATDLVANVTIAGQIYLRDTCRSSTGPVAGCTPITVLVSVDANGNPADVRSGQSLSISAGGRFVAFSSQASNLPGGSSLLTAQDYVRDTCINTGCTPSTIIVSVDGAGNPAPSGDINQHPSLSGDGRFVAFASRSALAPGSSTVANIFLRDTCQSETGPAGNCTPATSTVSVAADGTAANNDNAVSPRSLSADGRLVLFISLATNIVAGATQQFGVYVRDTCTGVLLSGCSPATRLISIDRNGGFVASRFDGSAISADGHYGAFVVFANSGPNSDQAVLALTGF